MIIVDETDPIDELEPTFPFRDVITRRDVSLREAYDVQSEIGRGKFGRVFRCKDRETGLMLAAKVVTTKRKDERRNVEREIEIMKKLQHPRLIQLFDAIDDVVHSEMCLILEMVGGGELFDRVIQDEFVLTERACAVFVRQITEAVEYIHSQNVLHLDMKPENVMCLSKKGNRIKIIDFGLARFYDPTKKLQVLFGTPEFVAPEVVNFEAIDYATDMWSIGVITYVLLSGLSPFMGETDVETMANVTIAKYDYDDECFDDISDDAKDFISKLLVKDKKKRMTASQCRKHRWLLPLPRTPLESSSPPHFPTTTTTNTNQLTISCSTSISKEEEEEDDDVPVITSPSQPAATMSTPSKLKLIITTATPSTVTAAAVVEQATITTPPKTATTIHKNVGKVSKLSENDEEVSTTTSSSTNVKRNSSPSSTVRLVNLIQSSTCNNSNGTTTTTTTTIATAGDQSESESGYSGSGHSESSMSLHNNSNNNNNNSSSSCSSSSCVPIISSESKNRPRLDLTKDNLRDFVARWTDTPYLFDSPNGIITHLCTAGETEKTIADSSSTGACHAHYHNHHHNNNNNNASSSHNNNLNTTHAGGGGETSLSNDTSFENCGVNIVQQIRRFSYQLTEELQLIKNHCNKSSLRKGSWSEISVNAQ